MGQNLNFERRTGRHQVVFQPELSRVFQRSGFYACLDELFCRIYCHEYNFAVEPHSRSLRRASIPFKIGMLISVTTTSGWSLRILSPKLTIRCRPYIKIGTQEISALSRFGLSSANRTRGRFKVRLSPAWMRTRSNRRPGRFTWSVEGIVGMNSAPLGKSLGGVPLNRKLLAVPVNGIHAGRFGIE
jgi:hypothetical protein